MTDLTTKLAEALRDLLTEQNGPPLVRRRASWEKAVDAASEALAEFDAQAATRTEQALPPSHIRVTAAALLKQLAETFPREELDLEAVAMLARAAQSAQPLPVRADELEAAFKEGWQARASLTPPAPEAQQAEPIGQLFQHDETGRTRVVLRDQVADCDARWFKVGDLFLGQQPAQAVPLSVPHPGSPEASAMIDSELALRGWPANQKNAARAGYEACRKLAGLGVKLAGGGEGV